MTKLEPYIFRKDNKDRWSNIWYTLSTQVVKMMVGFNEDFQVEIKPYSKRSQNALAAYWCLIAAVVKWDADNNGLSKDVWDEWFKREAGLVEEVDLMPIYQIQYRNIRLKTYKDYEEGIIIFDGTNCSCRSDRCSSSLCDRSNILVERYIEKTRSLSNKGDVTKIEMERLLNTVIKFGADNLIPNCFIKNEELDKLLKFYDK